MDKEILEQFQMLASMMENLPTKKYVQDLIEESRRHTEILIENTVTKRIDSLFDGYKLTHEKQYELERRMESLERKIEELSHKIA